MSEPCCQPLPPAARGDGMGHVDPAVRGRVVEPSGGGGRKSGERRVVFEGAGTLPGDATGDTASVAVADGGCDLGFREFNVARRGSRC
jgi:hypothetical protein